MTGMVGAPRPRVMLRNNNRVTGNAQLSIVRETDAATVTTAPVTRVATDAKIGLILSGWV